MRTFPATGEALRRGIPVDGHVPFRVTPEEAADAGQRTFEHVLAMAAGCSTSAAAERERFASVLSPLAGSPALESLSPMVLFHHEPGRTDDDVETIAEGLTTSTLPVRPAVEGLDMEV